MQIFNKKRMSYCFALTSGFRYKKKTSVSSTYVDTNCKFLLKFKRNCDEIRVLCF